MPKRKTAAVVAPPAEVEESSGESAGEETAPSPKKGKNTPKKAADVRGRGRPPLSSEEKAKRDAEKAPKSGRGRGRPKGTAKKTKSPKKK